MMLEYNLSRRRTKTLIIELKVKTLQINQDNVSLLYWTPKKILTTTHIHTNYLIFQDFDVDRRISSQKTHIWAEYLVNNVQKRSFDFIFLLLSSILNSLQMNLLQKKEEFVRLVVINVFYSNDAIFLFFCFTRDWKYDYDRI